MKADQFLKEKGIMEQGTIEFIISFEDGRKFDLILLFEEYAQLKIKEKGENTILIVD